MKILLTDKEKLDLIYKLLCNHNYYFGEQEVLLDADDKEYEISKKNATPIDDFLSSSLCYEEVLISMLKNGYNLRLVDALHFAEDVDNLQIVATFNLKEIFHNLDNLQLDNNYYDDEEGVAKDILLMLTGDYDVHPVTRLMSIIFPLNETTRK